MTDMKNVTLARLNGMAVVILEGGWFMSKVRFASGPMSEWFLVMNERLTEF